MEKNCGMKTTTKIKGIAGELKPKERPILFSSEMVKAILNGSKTQTRRALALQPLEMLTKLPPWNDTVTRQWNGCKVWFALMQRNPNRGTAFRCRFGEVGNHLWVRETWRRDSRDGQCFYRAACVYPERFIWKPSIFMPRSASRITLEIVSVRVEKLQDITEADAVAEGCIPCMEHSADCNNDYCALAGGVGDCDGSMVSGKMLYRSLWESINGKGSFEKNPWIWVIQFRKIPNRLEAK